MDPDIRNVFFDISRIQTFGKRCTLIVKSFIYYLQKHLFSLLCHDSKSVYGGGAQPFLTQDLLFK